MTTTTISAKAVPAANAKTRVPTLPAYFPWVTIFFGVWFSFGLYLDGWAHSSKQIDTFFTPWHLVLYSGLMGAAAWLHVNYTRYLLKGFSPFSALPRPYLLSMVGCWLFLGGGGFDFLWHSWFGFERDLEALLSPAHLLLATGGALYSVGPLRVALRHPQWRTWRQLFPALCALLLLMNVVSFFAMYAHIFGNLSILINFPDGTHRFYVDTFGVFEIMLPTMLIGLAFLFVMRNWEVLPRGTIAFLFGIHAFSMLLMRVPFTADYPLLWVTTLVTTGVLEGLFIFLRPSAKRIVQLRLFAAFWPLIWLLLLFGAQQAFYQLWWSIHLWLGATIAAGLVSLLVSYVVFPPQLDTDIAPDTLAE